MAINNEGTLKFIPKTNFAILLGLAVFATCVANVMSSLVAPFNLGPFMLSGGFFTFPLLYVASDIMSRTYGYKASRVTALYCAIFNVLMIVIFEIGFFFLPGGKEALAPLHITAGIVTVAGLVMGYIGDWGNDIAFVFIRDKLNLPFYVQAIGSSIVGQTIDSFGFVFLGLGIAFHLPVSAMLINAGSQILFKLLVETVLFPATYGISKRIERSEGVYDR